MRARFAAFGSVLVGIVAWSLFLAAPARADLSSIDNPQGVAAEAELAAQNGGSALTPGQLAQLDQMEAGLAAGEVSSTSGSQMLVSSATGAAPAAASAGLSVSSVWGSIAVNGVGLLLGGAASWALNAGSSPQTSLPMPPAGPATTYLWSDASAPWNVPAVSVTSLSLTAAGDLSSIAWTNLHPRTDMGDYGCGVTVYYLKPGATFPSSYSGISSALTADNLRSFQSQQWGFSNGGHCYNAGVSISGLSGRGTVPSTWTLAAVSVSEYNFTSTSSWNSYNTWFSVTPGSSSGAVPRTVEQTVTCKRADGSSHTITNTTTGAIWSPGDMQTVAGLMCPSGERASSWDAKVKTSGAPDVSVGSVTYPDTSWVPSTCLGSTACTVRLQYKTDTGWETCVIGAVGPCTNWEADPNKKQDFQCQLGAGSTWAVVQLRTCTILDNAFTDTPTKTPPHDLPDPDSGCGLSWGDVLNGTVVFKAVGCALAWAFVPSPTTMVDVQTQVSDAWNGTAPGQIVGAVSDVYQPIRDLPSTPEADCLGPEVDWSWGYLSHAHPFQTCTGLPHDLSLYFKPILGAVALLAALGQSARTLAGTISLPTPRAVAS